MTSRERVLSRRELNRAYLERQLLSTRVKLSPHDALRHLLGLQSQQPMPPYFGLWSRLDGFEPAGLARPLLDKSVVRATLMRCTVHVVTADDCLLLRPLMAPVIDKQLFGNPGRAAELKKVDDIGELAEAARELLDEPRGTKELGERLGVRWPHCKPAELARAAQFLVPVLQTPPRGVWGNNGGQPAWAAIESWLGRPLDTGGRLGHVLSRYLAAFGPASVADMQKWSGLSGLAKVCAGLELRTFRDERGKQLLDVPGVPLPGEDAPAPVRLLAEYDNAILSHADRSRIMDEAYVGKVVTKNGIVRGAVLVDGFVQGIWHLDRQSLLITPFRAFTKAEVADVEDEGARLLAFAVPDGLHHDVRLGPVQ